jgi:hypothetical protein
MTNKDFYERPFLQARAKNIKYGESGAAPFIFCSQASGNPSKLRESNEVTLGPPSGRMPSGCFIMELLVFFEAKLSPSPIFRR